MVPVKFKKKETTQETLQRGGVLCTTEKFGNAPGEKAKPPLKTDICG